MSATRDPSARVTAENCHEHVPFLIVSSSGNTSASSRGLHLPRVGATRDDPVPACPAPLSKGEWIAKELDQYPPVWRDLCGLCERLANGDERYHGRHEVQFR